MADRTPQYDTTVCRCECCGEDVNEVIIMMGHALCPECHTQFLEQMACPNGRCQG